MDNFKFIPKYRVKKIENNLKEMLENINDCHFYVAGSCLKNDCCKDIDLFFVDKTQLEIINTSFDECDKHVTKNAVTLIKAKIPIQLCKTYFKSLNEMVNRFDFASTKAGLRYSWSKEKQVLVLEEAIIHDSFIKYMISGINTYEQPAYEKRSDKIFPLASLIRCLKFSRRGDMIPNGNIFTILNNIFLLKGIDYDDFKRQLNAIDLENIGDDYEKAYDFFVNNIEEG